MAGDDDAHRGDRTLYLITITILVIRRKPSDRDTSSLSLITLAQEVVGIVLGVVIAIKPLVQPNPFPRRVTCRNLVHPCLRIIGCDPVVDIPDPAGNVR